MSPSINATLKKMYDEDAQERYLRNMCQPIEEPPVHLKVGPKSAWALLHDEQYKGVDVKDLIDLANSRLGRQFRFQAIDATHCRLVPLDEVEPSKAVTDRAAAIAVLRGLRL
jgi:hypothetical protein